MLTVFHALYGHILRTIVHPDIHDTRIALRLTHGIGYAAATLGMLYPKVAYGFVGIGEGQIATLGM